MKSTINISLSQDTIEKLSEILTQGVGAIAI
jgi:hypothetical protein